MKKEDLLDFNYGDKILVTYKNLGQRDDPRGVRYPEIQQDIGFFLELKDNILFVARNNPTLVGGLEDLPEAGEYGPPDDTGRSYEKRSLLLDETIHSLEEIIYIERI